MHDKVMEAMTTDDERQGAQIILRSLSAPVKQIAMNAGLEGAVVLSKVQANTDFNFGWNAAKNVYTDLIEDGVIDPAKVEINAIENSASVAGLVLTTECLVTEIPVVKDERAIQDEFDAAGMNAGMADPGAGGGF